MDYHKLLRELAEEREALNQAIAAIAPLVAKGSKKRGRPKLYGSKTKPFAQK